MSEATPRLRMFAGPNGSGKSTLKSLLRPELMGVYLNPDEIEKLIRSQGAWDLSQYGLTVDDHRAEAYFAGSEYLRSKGLGNDARLVRCRNGCLDFSGIQINSYFASVTAELLRDSLLDAKATFTLETVMSHPSKVELLEHAQSVGFRTYLYFIATDDPDINVSRVANRVRLGGHDVPRGKIVNRYYRSLKLLYDAIKLTNRAYVFDNSQESGSRDHTWIAEITDGKVLEARDGTVPQWFDEYVLKKIPKT